MTWNILKMITSPKSLLQTQCPRTLAIFKRRKKCQKIFQFLMQELHQLWYAIIVGKKGHLIVLYRDPKQDLVELKSFRGDKPSTTNKGGYGYLGKWLSCL